MVESFLRISIYRLASALSLVCMLLICSLLISCSSGNTGAQVVPNEVPATVSLSPANTVSLELGKTQAFIALAQNSVGTTVTETFSFDSSAPGIVTVANNGQACAGTWDSLSAPVVCTPGSTGTAQITASANGVISPPVTIYVHQHVTSVIIQKVPGQAPTLSPTCFSKGAPTGPESVLYEAFAYAGTTDITSSVGNFTWGTIAITGQSALSGTVELQPLPANAPLNQELATANIPGTASIFASAGGLTSQPVAFTTCPVESISFSVNGAPPTGPFVISPGSSLTINATATDSLGQTLTGVPLTWSSNNPSGVAVSGGNSTIYASAASITSAGGSAAVTASCTPPACNGGISPSLSIYPAQAISVQVSAATGGSTGSDATPTAYATTTACANTAQSCTTRIVPITRSSATSAFSAGAPLNLPSTPNSFVFGPSTSSSGFLGVENQAFGTQGLMAFTGAAVSQANGTAGRVLAISPDGNTVILSDTTDSPSRVIICKGCSGPGRIMTPILFANAAAAAFSSEGTVGSVSGYKAFVVSGSSCPGTSSTGCLLVYSTVDAPQLVPLTAPATDTSFIGEGAFGFIAGGDPAGMTYLGTCLVPPSSSGALATVSASSQMLRAMPDGYSVLSLSPPNLQVITANLSGSGCPSPRGNLNIANTIGPTMNLGVGTFTPTQFFLSPDGQTAYIVGKTTGGAPLPFIISFNLTMSTTSLISLAGSATPLNASISPAGTLLFVGANDGQVHVIDTATGFDIQQVPLPFPQSGLCIGPGNPVTQVLLSSATVAAATQSGLSTTYTYTLGANSAPLAVGETVAVSGMADAGNNGTFTISSLGTGTFTVANGSGTTASGQNGTANVPLPCNPDLVAVKP